MDYDDNNPFDVGEEAPKQKVTFKVGTKPGGPTCQQSRQQRSKPIYTTGKLQGYVGGQKTTQKHPRKHARDAQGSQYKKHFSNKKAKTATMQKQ